MSHLPLAAAGERRTANPALSLLAKVARRLRRTATASRRGARKLTAQVVFSIPTLSARNPRRRITTFRQYCRPVASVPSGQRRFGNWYLPLRPPEAVELTPSTALRPTDGLALRTGTDKHQGGDWLHFPEVFAAGIRDARILSPDVLLISPDNDIFFESALSRHDYLERTGILDTVVLPRGRRLEGEFWLLTNRSARAYYHWLIEVLPRLSIIGQFPELGSVPILVPEQLDGFRGESLKLAGIPAERMVRLPGGTCRPDQLYFPELLGPTGLPSPHAVAWLRKRFLSGVGPVPSASQRIYLTRSDASQRRVLNEPEVIEFLSDHGFEVVCPGALSFAEQVELFRTVDVVVAPHGAGLANLVFAPPGATVIEFFGDNYINGCFWALSSLCHQRHGFIVGPSTWLDYHVSLTDVGAILHKMGVD